MLEPDTSVGGTVGQDRGHSLSAEGGAVGPGGTVPSPRV